MPEAGRGVWEKQKEGDKKVQIFTGKMNKI